MSKSPYTRVPLLLVPLLLAACEGGPPWRSADEEQTAVDRDVFGPTAAYDRRLIFLGPGGELPTAAVFDFAALSDSAALRRGVRVRLVDGAEWVRLMDEGWEMEPMREPWRLVPRGRLKIVVGDAGDLDALLFRGEDVDLRLEAGPAIAEYSPDAGTQLVLRQGRLRLGDEPINGILLDAQLARAVSPAALPTPGTGPGSVDTAAAAGDTTAGAAAGSDTAAGAGVAGAGGGGGDGADTTGALAPAPAPVAGAEALLLDNSGYYAVFATSADGAMAWVHSGGRDDLRPGGRLEPMAWEPFPEAGVQVPTAWRISSPGGVLGGELRAEAGDRSILEGGGSPGVLGYVVVTGWLEDRGVRRNVYGLVRHVR